MDLIDHWQQNLYGIVSRHRGMPHVYTSTQASADKICFVANYVLRDVIDSLLCTTAGQTSDTLPQKRLTYHLAAGQTLGMTTSRSGRLPVKPIIS